MGGDVTTAKSQFHNFDLSFMTRGTPGEVLMFQATGAQGRWPRATLWRWFGRRAVLVVNRTIRVSLVALALAAGAIGTAVAGPFEDGLEAMQRGDYATATQLLLPLANQGDARAQLLLGQMKGATIGSSSANSRSIDPGAAVILLVLALGFVGLIIAVVGNRAASHQQVIGAPTTTDDDSAESIWTIFRRNSKLRRKPFWIWIGLLMATKTALLVGWRIFPSGLEVAILGLMASAVGARFSDIGWPKWVGVVLTVVITLVFPLAMIFAVAIPNRALVSPSPFDLPWYVGWPSTIGLAVLIIVGGTWPSRKARPSKESVALAARTSSA